VDEQQYSHARRTCAACGCVKLPKVKAQLASTHLKVEVQELQQQQQAKQAR
jgi:hypothetical protein